MSRENPLFSDTALKWVAGVMASVAVIAGGAAITTWADVREMKRAQESSVKAERIATLEGDLKAHELAATIRAAANDQRTASLEARVTSLERSREWQRNRETERPR